MREHAILSDLTGSASLASELLDHYGTLRAVLMDADAVERAGAAPGMAARLRAAVEVGALLAREDMARRETLASPAACARLLMPRYSALPVETFGVLLLNSQHGLLREVVISTGCLTASLVHPREVFKAAIDGRAAALVLFHNHPSGNPEPSAEDLALTRRLSTAGTLMGIEVLDHVVVGAGRYVSLKERGVL